MINFSKSGRYACGTGQFQQEKKSCLGRENELISCLGKAVKKI
jgi:hypothetical protein